MSAVGEVELAPRCATIEANAEPGWSSSTALLDAAQLAKHMDELISETRSESEEMFGESADNITAICVAFDSIAPKDAADVLV